MNALLLATIGSLIMLDKYSFGEFGISQPLIGSMIIGAVCGDIYTGIYLGAILQLMFLGGLPIGRDIPPDGQAAGIIGSGTYYLLRASNTAGQTLFLAVMCALVGSVVGGALDIVNRRLNERLYHCYMRNDHGLSLCHLIGLATSFIRSLCLFLPFFLLTTYLTIPTVFPELSQEFMLMVAMSIGIAHGIYLFIKRTTIVYAVIGGLCGLALLAF